MLTILLSYPKTMESKKNKKESKEFSAFMQALADCDGCLLQFDSTQSIDTSAIWIKCPSSLAIPTSFTIEQIGGNPIYGE